MLQAPVVIQLNLPRKSTVSETRQTWTCGRSFRSRARQGDSLKFVMRQASKAARAQRERLIHPKGGSGHAAVDAI